MKKVRLLVGLSLWGFFLAGNASLVCAAEADTQGSINFQKSTDTEGTIVKPEIPEKEIDPEGGNHSSGDLRIQYVPDFNFGNQEIKIGRQTYHPFLQKYTFVNGNAGNGEVGDKYMPHFIQVTDVRGKRQGWNLKVSATTFKTKDNEELPFATITLNQARLSNDIYITDAEISAKVETFAKDGHTLEIPTDASQARLVMGTIDNSATATTDGSRTSIVLDNSYDKDKLDYLATERNTQVVLTKTNKDVPVISEEGDDNKLYTSTITWTLTDGM